MSIHNNTKQSFADALKKTLFTKELHQIYIKELCDMVGAKRPTFYYHFQDKYDLVLWIYKQDLKHSLETTNGYYNAQQLEHLLALIRKEKTFYQKAFSDHSPNSLYLSIFNANLSIFSDIMKKQQHTHTLSIEQEFIIHFYSHAWIGCLYDWIHKKQEISAAEYANLMYQRIQHLNLSGIHATDYAV